ncbi:MAG: YaaA family protein [Rikenellaceae bacterium]
MLALISPAKTMQSEPSILTSDGIKYSTPRFLEQTKQITSLMLHYNSHELQDIFKISAPIAQQLRARFTQLLESETDEIAAIDSYNGVVYKHFKSDERCTLDDYTYLQNRLRISSLLYGLLRPFDAIKPYRMEGFVRLAGHDERVDRFWRRHQTQTLIDDVNHAGETLLYLASKEEQNAFHWREVENSVKVIDFLFLQQKGDRLKQVVVYTKMARGEMIRHMIANKITKPEELKEFEWSGYRYNNELSTENKWVWVMD